MLQLHQVFLNLLSNAAQAMGSGGRLCVRTERDDDFFVVRIRDTGSGISERIRNRIFEPFFTTKSRGGGLGLAIARRTIELHGGTIVLDCPTTGGTVMTVVLPRVTATEGSLTAATQ